MCPCMNVSSSQCVPVWMSLHPNVSLYECLSIPVCPCMNVSSSQCVPVWMSLHPIVSLYDLPISFSVMWSLENFLTTGTGNEPHRSLMFFSLEVTASLLDPDIFLSTVFSNIRTLLFFTVVFYLPTDAQESCFKKSIKIYIKTAPTCFGLITIIRERIIRACWSCSC
jgi:hypothetical protein